MKTIDNNNNRAYILHFTEVIEGRPNLDPFTGSLRIENETQQIRTSDVCIKHHIRRTFPRILNNPQATFFQKYNPETGEGVTAANQLKELRKAKNIEKENELDPMIHCADTVLFGYVHTAKKGESYHRNGAAQALFWPSTFHACKTEGWGTSNAWCKDDGQPTGGATQDILIYGVFITLIEVDLNTLDINSKDSKIFPKEEGATPWIKLLADGLWDAFDTQRVSSRTQKSHFSKAQIVWQPTQKDVNPVNPLQAIELLEEKEIHNWVQAETALREKVMPWLSENYAITPENVKASRTKRPYNLGELFQE